MNILAFKLLVTPALILALTLAGRRWGPMVSGLLIGLPLTSGPISCFLAIQHGTAFAAQAAIGNLAGQTSTLLFCLAYMLLARRYAWPICTLMACGVFFLSTWFLNFIVWQLWPALLAEVALSLAILHFVRPQRLMSGKLNPPSWDIPARIGVATLFLLALTGTSAYLGPQLSGMLSPFPLFAAIFAAFVYSQQGWKSAVNLIRGVVIGSWCYSLFFLLVGLLLPRLNIVASYFLASCASMSLGALIQWFALRRR